MYYIIPTIQTTLPGSNQTVTAPKYVDFTIPFSSVPFGLEGWTILSISASIAPAADLYQFPQDLTQALADTDVTAFDSFLGSTNTPSDFITVGMEFGDVLRGLCQIFLLAQSISGAVGTSIFPSGTTLSSTVGTVQSASAGKIKSGGTTQPTSALATAVDAGQVGVFDFSSVDPESSISDVLISVSQQFTSGIDFNGASL